MASTDAVVSQEAKQWMCVMEVAQPLPQINLENTMLSKILSPSAHDRFLEVMRRQYTRFGMMYRLASVLGLVIVFLDRDIGRILSPIPTVLAVPAISCSFLMLSSDLLAILVWQYEFWFFTILNTINWVTLAIFYADARIISLYSGLFGTQSVIFIDANFRTIVSALKSCVVAAPVLCIVAAACFFRLLDVPVENYLVIPVAHINVTLVDVFVNTAITLAIFIARKAYSKRKVLRESKQNLRIVRCVVFRSKLRLRQVSTSHPLDENRQQVTLVSLKLECVDVRRTLWPKWTPLEEPVAWSWMAFLLANGVVGLTTTAMTLSCSHPQAGVPDEDDTTQQQRIVAIVALVSTSVCCLPFLACSQRDLLKSLLNSFDFLFSSIQFGLAMLFLADMLRWDYRALGALAWFLWFHFVLLLDTWTPPIKTHLRFRKLYTVPVISLSLVGVAAIVYSFFFTKIDIFEERTLFAFQLNGHAIAARTKSLLLNRLFTVFLWSARLVWEVSYCPDNELIFIRGGLDYYNPMEMFPPFSEAAIAPMVTTVRRLSRKFSMELPGRVPNQE
uniref:Uncharacterized protein n=1 Tax=Globisporangium ultimum (strain ATCC 200006 / CBS 805.95 / DAOM BR144) TaxID=431595 RepID=K3WJI1_GLOUD